VATTPAQSYAFASGIVLPPERVVSVDGLSVRFATSERTVEAVRNLSFHVDRGETLAVVGESGSGKSVTSLALMRLVEHGGGRIASGSMLLRRRGGEVIDLARADNATLRSVRGADVAMIFQEPMTSLNPVFPVGEQIAESIRLHQGKSRAAARAGRCACWNWCAFPRRAACWSATRTSSPAACASA
jgi:glutathione transport system ATP-binding protein